MMMNELETLIELQKIHTLLSTYTLTIDSEDAAGWAACFTEDGCFVSGDRQIVGRAKLQRYAEIHNRAFGSRHITASPVYEIDASGATARGKATTVLAAATRSGYKTCFAGWYEDELAKVAGQWLIAKRVGSAAGIPGDPEYPVLTSDPETAPLVQLLLDAWEELGDPV